MKKFSSLFVSVAAAAMALVSCQVEDSVIDNPSEEAVTIRVHASANELKSDDPATKTYIDNTNTIIWGTGEYMKLALTVGENTTFVNSTDASADAFNGDPEAMFEFSVSPESANEYVYQGLYPASAAATNSNTNAANYKVNLPAIQNATASSYDPAAYIMVAKPKSFDAVQTDWMASFRRATALNKITLKNFASSVEINKVKITAEGKTLAGGRHFNLTTGEGLEVYGTDATIEVLYATPLSGTSMDVWFTSWDTEIAEDEKLTIVAYTTDNKSYTKEIIVPAGKSIKFQEGYLNTLGAKFDGIDPEDVATISGDFVILAKHNTNYYALKGEASGTRIASVNYTGSTTSYNGDASIIWTITPSGSCYTIKNGDNYLGWNGGTGSAANNAILIASANYNEDKCLMGISDQGEGIYHISSNNDSSRILAKNTGSDYFAFYASTGQYTDIILVPATSLEVVKTPTFNPAAGEVTSGTEVTISSATDGATIYYTTDGSDPTTASTQGTSVTITATTTIKAIAVKDGMANSEVASAQYTITGVTDYSVIETSNVTLSTNGGTSASAATVNSESALKAGTGSVAGAVKITVPAGTTKLHLHAAGWNGETVELGITGATASPSSLSLTADSGVKNNTPFTLNGNAANYYFCVNLSGISTDTELTFSATSGKRFVIWGVNAEAGASVTWNLDSIAITTEPTKTTYTEGQSFDPAGMVVTGHFVDADDNANTKDEAVTGYTITPDGALSTSDDHVTITYQGKTTAQAITVNAPSYDFETVAELNTLAESLSNNETATYSGALSAAVISYVPDSGNAIIKDASGSILVYKSNHGYLQGQTFSGELEVTVKMFYTTIEITAIDADFTGSESEIQPAVMTLADLEGNFSTYQNAYVKVESLTVDSRDGKNITVSNGGKTYLVYDNAGTSTAAAGDVITAVGTIGDHNGTNQIKVWASNNITITASAPKAITFSQPAGAAGTAGCSFTVSVGGSPISNGDTVASGTTVTLSATAGTDYEFTSWTVEGATVADASSATTTFEMGTSAVSISASFSSTSGETQDYTTTWTATSGGLGAGIGSGTINTTVSGSATTQQWSYTRTLSSGTSYTGWTSNCIQLGKNGGVENLELRTSKIPGTIKSVSVECSSYQGKHNVAITVGGSTYLSSTATATWTTVSANSGTGTSTGEIVISFTGGSRALYIKSITVVYNN